MLISSSFARSLNKLNRGQFDYLIGLLAFTAMASLAVKGRRRSISLLVLGLILAATFSTGEVKGKKNQ